MKIITLEEGLKVYNFKKEAKGEFVGYNLLLLEDGDNCLIVDTAFKRHFKLLLEDLTTNKKKISKAVITHFHKDHIGGITKLGDIPIYASKNAEITIKKVFKQDYSKYMPNVLVENETIYFGGFKVDLVQNIGHSIDGLLVIINDKYVFVGDDMIYDIDDKELLPFASEGDFDAHVDSLNRIKQVAQGGIIIPSHGPILSNQEYFNQDIDKRIMFLKFKKANPEKNHTHFYEETGVYFSGIEWYKGNV